MESCSGGAAAAANGRSAAATAPARSAGTTPRRSGGAALPGKQRRGSRRPGPLAGPGFAGSPSERSGGGSVGAAERHRAPRDPGAPLGAAEGCGRGRNAPREELRAARGRALALLPAVRCRAVQSEIPRGRELRVCARAARAGLCDRLLTSCYRFWSGYIRAPVDTVNIREENAEENAAPFWSQPACGCVLQSSAVTLRSLRKTPRETKLLNDN